MTRLQDLVLHPASRELVERLIQNMPQALVLTGPSGLGVTAVAKAIARELGSAQLLVEPKRRLEGGKKLVVDHEKGSIIIEDIRELYTLTRSKNKSVQIYIFDFSGRTMTHQAQNAFLKLLEEPRDNVHFILATDRPDALLPTVLSRSQRLDLRKITVAQTAELLDTLRLTDATKRARITFAASGLPAAISRLATDDTLYEKRVAVMQDAKTLISGEAFDKLAVIHRYKDDRAGSIMLIDDVNLQLETVLRKTGDSKLAEQITAHLKTREKIIANGNIRLHLAADML